jgi:hypothetical protein
LLILELVEALPPLLLLLVVEGGLTPLALLQYNQQNPRKNANPIISEARYK